MFTKKALEQENVISICLPVPTMTAKPLEFSTPQWPEGQAKTYWPGSVHPPIYPSIYLSIHPASQPTSKSKQRTPKVTLWETTFSVANLWWLFRYTCGVDGSNKERGTYQTAGRLIACEQALCWGKNSEEREGEGGREFSLFPLPTPLD